MLGDGGLVVRAPNLEVLVFGNFEREGFCQDEEGAGRVKLCAPQNWPGASALSMVTWTSYSSVSPVASERTGRCFSFKSL